MNQPSTRPQLEVQWIQPKSFVQQYELREYGTLAGTLTFHGLASTRATAEIHHGTWTFEQAGILDDRVLVHDVCSGLEVAVFEPRLLGDGTLTLVDGRRLTWESTNFWGSEWRFMDELGNQPVAFKSGVANSRFRDLFKAQATVSLDRTGWSQAELCLLTALGWYLILLRQRQAAVVVTAT